MSHSLQRVVLKAGKDKPLKHKHHWIFSGAIATMPPCEAGALLPVYSHDGELLGHGYFNTRCSLRGRMLSFGSQGPLEGLKAALTQAFALRKRLIDESTTTAFRIVNGEGDALPGLIIDRYGDVLVVQMHTAGMERLREEILAFLLEQGTWRGIYEKSKGPSRRDEGLDDREGWLYGSSEGDTVSFKENDLLWTAHLPTAQKTGFFLDQRAMRQYVATLAGGKSILNCFAYTGGFSLYALQGGAHHVTSVDISAAAVAAMEGHTRLNALAMERHTLHQADVFVFLREQDLATYDLIILDPPAFTKHKKDVAAACRGYKEINRLALRKMAAGTLLVTCSCSYHIDPALFQMLLFQAAHEAGREVRIVARHHHAADHPVNLYHPEGDYLKSLVLYVC